MISSYILFIPSNNTACVFFNRNQSSLGVHFEKLQVLPVMSCISSLCTNPLNKDMLAGGTYSGMNYKDNLPFNYKIKLIN